MKSYSVLMSVYAKEQPQFFKLAIESILNQTVSTNEFVIVCDGPLTQALDDVLDSYSDKYKSLFKFIRLPQNLGLGPALREGIRYCNNELIARMDSDDISCLTRMQRQLQLFDEDEKLDFCSGHIAEFDNNPQDIVAYRRVACTHSEILEYAHKRNPMNHMAVMYKKSKVLGVGGYEDIKGFEDYFLWVKMLQNRCRARNIDDVLVFARVGNGMSKRRGGIKYLRQIAYLERKFYKMGFLSQKEYIFNTIVRSSICLMPNDIRQFIYKSFLRV